MPLLLFKMFAYFSLYHKCGVRHCLMAESRHSVVVTLSRISDEPLNLIWFMDEKLFIVLNSNERTRRTVYVNFHSILEDRFVDERRCFFLNTWYTTFHINVLLNWTQATAWTNLYDNSAADSGKLQLPVIARNLAYCAVIRYHKPAIFYVRVRRNTAEVA